MKNIFKHILLPTALLIGTSSILTSISLSFNSSNTSESSSYYNSLGRKLIKNQDTIVLLNKSSNKEDLFKELNDNNISYDFVESYEGIIHGVRLNINSNNTSKLKSLSSVLSVDENSYYTISSNSFDVENNVEEIYKTPLDNDSIKDMNVPSSSVTNDGEGVLVAILDDSFNIHHEAFKDLDSSIDVKVSKSNVDSIVKSSDFEADLTNLNYYLNRKIPYYHDYGGTLNKTTYEPIKEDDDLMYSSGVHGSHVASILGANGTFKGVAPNAQLALMKVGGEVPGLSGDNILSDDAIFKALNDAYYLGADIVSCSFGTDLDESSLTEDENAQILISRLKENGTEVNFASGNNGKGNFNTFESYRYDNVNNVENGSLGGYNVLDGVTSVASTNLTSDNSVTSDVSTVSGIKIYGYDEITSSLLNYNSEPKMMRSLLDNDETVGKFEYVIVPGVGDNSDYNDVDVTGKVALVKRGDIDLVSKIKNAKSHGAIGIIIANQEGLGSLINYDLQGNRSDDLIPTYSISYESYETLLNQEEKAIYITKSLASDFSSEGSSQLLDINPQISAPGQNIAGISASNNGVTTNNEYRYLSGTSMATPNFSGAEALILSSQDFKDENEEKEFKDTLLNRIMSTADPIKQANGSYVSVRKVGAGEVDVSDAIKTKIYLEDPLTHESAIELKNNPEISEGHVKFDINIVNKENLTGNYTLNLSLGTPTITYVDSENSNGFLKGEKVQDSFYTKEVISDSFKVNLDGNENQTISIDYQLDKSTLDSILEDFPNGTYLEGYVTLNNDTNNANLADLSIPVLGFLGDYHKEDVIEPYNFEKEYYGDNKVYSSDMLNNFGETLGFKAMNFGSFMGVTNLSLDQIDMESVILNEKSIDDLFIPINYSYDENEDKFILYAGNIGSADTLYIQNFVNRSVKTNEITLTSLDTNKVVLTDHMFDTMVSEENDYSLVKSKASVNLVNNGIFADFAYTIIPLKDKESGNYFEDGTYSLKFTYTLFDDYTYTKEYILEIDSEVNDVELAEIYYDTKTLTIVSSKDDIAQVRVNGEVLTKTELDNGSFSFTLNLNEIVLPGFNDLFNSYNDLFIEVIGKNYGVLYGRSVSNLNALVFNKNINETDVVYLDSINYGLYNGNKNTLGYSLSITNRVGMYQKLDKESPYIVVLSLDDRYINADSMVYSLSDENGSSSNLTSLSSNKDGSSLTFTFDNSKNIKSANSYDFLVTFSGDIKSDINLPLVIGLSVVGGLIVIGLIVTFIVVMKDKKNNND